MSWCFLTHFKYLITSQKYSSVKITEGKISRTFKSVLIVFDSFWTRNTIFSRKIFIRWFLFIRFFMSLIKMQNLFLYFQVIESILNTMTCTAQVENLLSLWFKNNWNHRFEIFCVLSSFQIRKLFEKAATKNLELVVYSVYRM